MKYLATRRQLSEGWALRSGASYTFQLTLPIVFLHRRDLLDAQNEAFRLVSTDGSYDVTHDVAAATPYDETYAALSFTCLSRGARYSLFRLTGPERLSTPVFENASYTDLESQPPPATVIAEPGDASNR